LRSILASVQKSWRDHFNLRCDNIGAKLYWNGESPTENMRHTLFSVVAGVLLILMAVLAGGAALRESVTVDEVAHIGAGLSYLQKLDLRLNEEHPPLPKVLAVLPLVLRGTHADYSNISWTFSETFFPAYLGQWVFGEWILTKWNDPISTLAWARAPMLVVALVLGGVLFVYARKLGGDWGGLLCLSGYVSTPAFIAFAPLVHTDLAVTLFSLLTLWRFAEIWQNPTRKNAVLFAICLAAALLSKFTAIILFCAFVAFALSTRWRPVSGQPIPKPEARAWRRLRWRVTLRGILCAAIIVYLFYFIFSMNQPTSALDRLGHGTATEPLRRILMPLWLYLRGVLLVLVTGSRPTYILGHGYPHGVWFYFPVLFLLKSTLGFLGLLALALVLALTQKGEDEARTRAIPNELVIHWRVLWVSLLVFTGFCLLSRLDISIRHFSLPLILLILLLAPLPRMIERLQHFAPNVARIVAALVVVLTLTCLFTVVRTYPFYFPYINALRSGRPGYALVNDSNLDWNQSLPEVKNFADQHRLQSIDLDQYGFTDPIVDVPQAHIWNCQTPAAADAGQWAAVSANMIMDGHNCIWLMQYEHQPLAGGSMYAIHLPDRIPEAGNPNGPPRPSEFREFGGAPFDMRSFFLDIIHHPERIPQAWEEMQARFKSMNKPKSSSAMP
jgi:4-amino-4-deoxy-L-arabinose transferase-like glycosyltransferase